MVSRYWLATVVSARILHPGGGRLTRALADGKEQLLDDDLLAELASGEIPEGDDRLPVLVALSDNGPQMTSKATAAFMAGTRIAQHFGPVHATTRPGSVVLRPPQGRVPAPGETRDPGELEPNWTGCAPTNTIRLHEGIGYVTPDDEHPAAAPPSAPPAAPA